jgi:hypothetical protein
MNDAAVDVQHIHERFGDRLQVFARNRPVSGVIDACRAVREGVSTTSRRENPC